MANKKNITKKSKVDIKPIIIYVALNIVVGGMIGVILAVLAIVNSGGSEVSAETIQGDTALITSISAGISILTMIILACMYRKRLVEDAKRLKKKQWGLLLAASLGLVAINLAITSLFEFFGIEMSNQDSIISSMGQTLIVTAIMAAVAAPIVEELVFRYSLGTIIKNKIAFIIVSSVIFGLMHGVGVATILYIILGLFFVMAYLKTDNNIVASIVMHFINNLVGVIGIIIALGL